MQVRPIAADNPTANVRPVTVVRQSPDDKRASCTAVTHTYASLCFYTGGQSRVDLQGEWNLRAGDVLLVPAGEPHRMLQAQRPEIWVMTLCAPCFTADGTASLLDPFERVRDGASAVVQIPSVRHEYLGGLFRELENVGRNPHATRDAGDAIQRSLLTLILNEVERVSISGAAPRSSGSSVVVDALRFIERNCLRPLTLNEVAAAVKRSPPYVTTALTQATGRSAVQWIVSGRMAEARRLLLRSDEMIDVIAERVGYADATHFIRMFRRAYGVTPAAWRTAQMRRR